ncbi:MAG: hypothetical protein MUC81_06135, partial [Bacteroidia bacterium]|nr:hypothetical protein [Bacteroidia bacterium]
VFNSEYKLCRNKIIIEMKIQRVNKFGYTCLPLFVFRSYGAYWLLVILFFIMMLPLWGCINLPSTIFISSSVIS